MIYLNSRVQRIGGNGCGYRDIVIHEMTEGEIEFLKMSRWMLPIVGLIVGFIAGAIFMAGAILR